MEQRKEINVSIIVPVYNVEKYLCEFINSVLMQSITNFELILIDDGSTDNSINICDKYASEDIRIKVVHKKNSGVASARNYGLTLAKGKWVIFCDPDDYIEPLGIESLYTKGEFENADVVFGDINLIEGDRKQPIRFYKSEFTTSSNDIINELIKADFSRQFCFDPPEEGPARGYYGGAWNKLVKREILLEYSIKFDETLRGIFDDVLYTAYIFACSHKVAYIHDIIYNYRLLKSSITKTYKKDLLEINNAIFRSWEEFLRKYERKDEFEQPYYAVVIRRFSCLFGQYFFNKRNNKSLKKQLNELKLILNSEPYLTALKKANRKVIHTCKDKLFFTAAQIRSPYILFITYELYNFIKCIM